VFSPVGRDNSGGDFHVNLRVIAHPRWLAGCGDEKEYV